MNVAVIGAGSWGTALAMVASRAGHPVRLWARDASFADVLQRTRENSTYLKNIALPDTIEVTNSIAQAVDAADFVISAVPSHASRVIFGNLKKSIPASAILVSATKGIEIDTTMRMEELAADVFGPDLRYIALSGPTFALEVARDEPCAIVAASRDAGAAVATQKVLASRRFRVYTNSDVTGVEVGGAIKNVMAIATGAVNGLGLGYNSAAAIVTRGLAEIVRLAVGLGGQAETLSGLAGIGDLMLTCFGGLSRNRHVGLELGRGKSLEEITGQMREVAEGIKTSRAAHGLASRLGIEMPITTGVYKMLYEAKSPRELEVELMERPLKGE